MQTTTAAFFDLDGTLIPGSANIPLAKAAFRQGFVSKTDLIKDLRNGVSFLLKGATDERSEQVRDRILRAVQGRRAEDVEALGDHFIADLVGSIKPAMRDVLDQHGVAGVDRVVISASPTEIVSRLAHAAGLEHGAGTTAARDAEGIYTGGLVGPFCYKHPVAVNPEPELREIAIERGWPIVETSSVPRVKLTSVRGLFNLGTNLVGAASRRVFA